MELVIIGILGYMVSTIYDFKEIKELKKENEKLLNENIKLGEENSHLKFKLAEYEPAVVYIDEGKED